MKPSLNAVAKRDFKATCGHKVRTGERCFRYRERALSFAEARARNTMHPFRTRCAACVAAQVAQ